MTDSVTESMTPNHTSFPEDEYVERGPNDDPDEEISPADDLDEYWHEFLLDIRRYQEYCDYVFDYYVHHNPAPKLKQL